MEPVIVEKYVERVYAYAVKRTYTREEAEELSQEILFTVVRELPKLKDESRFEPWLWGVAQNVTRTFRRSMGKRQDMYYYNAPEDVFGVYEEAFDDTAGEREELYSRLRKEIAMLSSIYRNIIILYYYEGLSTKQISERLKIPEGTITWRLAEARKKIKKECVSEMEESALRPVKFHISIYGEGEYDGKRVPFPSEYIKDALSQNVLYHCYEQPKTVEELARLCGVPAYYIEETIDNLVKREAVATPVKGKYQTNFIIWTDKYGEYCEENAEKCLEPVLDKMVDVFRKIAEGAKKIDFYRAGKSEDELFYLYGAMVMKYEGKRHPVLSYPRMAIKYDGYRWNYMGDMETGQHPRCGLGCQVSGNSDGNYKHFVYTFHCLDVFCYKPMMNSHSIDICEEIISKGTTKDPEGAAMLIQDGYVERRPDGSFRVKTPAFTQEQMREFFDMAGGYLEPVLKEYSQAVECFIKGYKKQFPEHLGEDADRMCCSMFLGMFDVIAAYARRKGVAARLPEKGVCDVLLQHWDPEE